MDINDDAIFFHVWAESHKLSFEGTTSIPCGGYIKA